MSGETSNPGAGGWRPYCSLAARWTLGMLFVYMGLSKAWHPVEFLKLVRQYEMIDRPFALNLVASTLPWIEVWLGLLLCAGIGVRGTALISVAMLIGFSWIVFRRAWEIHGLQGIPFCAVRFDCGCGAGVVAICNKLAENSALVSLAVFLAASRPTRGCWRWDLFRRNPW